MAQAAISAPASDWPSGRQGGREGGSGCKKGSLIPSPSLTRSVSFITRLWVAENLERPTQVRYDPYTQSIVVLDSASGLKEVINQTKVELNHLSNALCRIQNLDMDT